MKQGKTLNELAAEITRQRDVKHDYIVDSPAMSMSSDAKQLVVQKLGAQFGINDHARRQLAEKLGIPFDYFKRVEEKHPAVIADHVNKLLEREPSRSMVRTLDGNVRAVLSDRYRPLDNYDLADAVLPVIRESGAVVESCEVTDRRMYIKLRMPWLDRELPMPEGFVRGVGHNIFARHVFGAATISNSETGGGLLAVSPAVIERECTNLAVFKDEGFSRMHIGKKAAGDDAAFKYLSDDTKRLDDAAVWARVRDVLKATMDGRVLDEIVKKLNAAREDIIDINPADVVEVFGKKNGFNEDEKGGLLRHLANSGEMTRYGLQWAVTRLAGETDDYDRASDLERLGGQVIELPRNDWQQLLKAA